MHTQCAMDHEVTLNVWFLFVIGMKSFPFSFIFLDLMSNNVHLNSKRGKVSAYACSLGGIEA